MGLTIAQLSARLRCAECVGQLHSVKPWRLDDVLGKPLGRRVDYSPSSYSDEVLWTDLSETSHGAYSKGVLVIGRPYS